MMFRDALVSAYREEPCQVLPNALWKTLAEVDNFETSFEVENDVVRHLEMWDEEGLHLYWHRDRQPPNISRDRLSRLKFMLIHQDYLGTLPIEPFTRRKAYFRLIHRMRAIPPVELPSGFCLVNVNVDTEVEAVAELIGRCYNGWHGQLSAQSVQNWACHPVFDRDSWIWVIDERKGIPAGLGIAEVDPTVQEASLEYIQVLPEYRRRGLGKGLVLELLARLQGRVEFTTVSGEVESRTKPEALYRRCGFGGSDVWWLLRC